MEQRELALAIFEWFAATDIYLTAWWAYEGKDGYEPLSDVTIDGKANLMALAEHIQSKLKPVVGSADD